MAFTVTPAQAYSGVIRSMSTTEGRKMYANQGYCTSSRRVYDCIPVGLYGFFLKELLKDTRAADHDWNDTVGILMIP
eukprot:scaffold27746_cov71-Attheya_sp.AAC.3